MILVAALTAVVLSSTPCADLPALDRALEQAEKAPQTWPAEKVKIEAAFAPLPFDAHSDEVKEQIAFARKRLHAFCDVAGATRPTFAAPDHAKLEAILARPELRDATNKNGEWAKALFRALWFWISTLLESKGAGKFAHTTRTLVLALAAGVIGFGLWRVLRMKRRTKRSAQPAEHAAPLRLDPPEDHLRRAHAALTSDPREAIREGLLALLSCLERRRLARPDRVKTNGEIVSELPRRGASAELVAQVTPVMRWYDRTFYSLAPVAPDQASAFLESVSGLRARLEGGA